MTRFQGTLLANKHHRVGVRLEYTNTEFVEYLKWLSKKTRHSKDDNFLISPALFVPDLENNTFRTLDNVQTSNGIWFDVENGNLPYDEWPRIFPHLEMVIYSTRFHTKEKPRYRVCILTDKMMSVAVYRDIWFQVKQRIIDEGYTENKITESNPSLKAHGIDNKHNPSDMFYLPCRTESGKHNIFKDIRGPVRKPLNVVDWIQHASDTEHNAEKTDAMISMVSDEGHTSLKGHQQQKIEEAKARFETVGRLPEEGDKSIWNLHLDLEKTGIDPYEHESILRNAARHTKSPSDRQAQISRLMKRKRWRVA